MSTPAETKTNTSSSISRRVQGYLSHKYHTLFDKEVKASKESESKLVAKAVKFYFDNKDKSNLQSTNHY